MLATTGALVPPGLFREAREYVERDRVPFFDFYRQCIFGFVYTGERRGRYAQVVIEENGELSSRCNCGEADFDEVCAHGFALFLKSMNWPRDKRNLPAAFEKHELCRFFKAVGRRHYDARVDETTNPRLDLAGVNVNPRLLAYWGFRTGENPALAKRDRRSLAEAKLRTRTKAEGDMLLRNFPPERVLFEESVFYPLCKLFFFLEQRGGLAIQVRQAEDHHVLLEILCGTVVMFDWRMPVDLYLKGIRDHWDYWRRRTRFEIRRQGVPLTYRIRFNRRSDLEIEPMISLGADAFAPMEETRVANARNLFHHQKLGYFRVQTGLSPFEMEFSEPRVHLIDHQQVKRFLGRHRPVLESMDRALMDESLFGEIVVERFHRLTLDLIEFQRDRFRFELRAHLGDLELERSELRQLFTGEGRYKKVGGRLFDGHGYDAAYLKWLYEMDGDELAVAALYRLISFFKDRLDIRTTELTETAFQRLAQMKAPESPDLGHTNLALRPYQQVGYDWLFFLKSFGLGGLLCDQMGLGKTHQGMALIAAAVKTKPESRVLVVAPASVMFHWLDKLNRFCPSLAVVIHHGPDRDAGRALRDAQVIVSSYGTMRNDLDRFEGVIFDVALFDEIQYLKNKGTKAYASLSRLGALCKIGLTGTPIENRLIELKNLMDLVFPGYLGEDSYFKRYFADPVLRFGDSKTGGRVKEMIKPFTLRRAKREVLQELPEKVEDIRAFPLSDYERDLYLDVRDRGKKSLDRAGKPEALHVFRLIGELKRVCDHPGLFFGNHDYAAYPSAKWELFTELLREAMDSGEKVVVFTQYLGMIEMFSRYLEDQGLGYAVLTGKTRDRAAQQQRFMTDPECRVFLGTVLAAGVGIDLTAASVVVHYDRWWNAAREEQATDRVHRIGQTRNVQIFKFKARNTIEERIDAIIQKKRKLLDDIVAFDGEGAAKAFSLAELLEILG